MQPNLVLVQERGIWALVTIDHDGQPDAVLMLLDDRTEAEEIAFELRRSGGQVLVVPFGPEQDPKAD